MPAYNSEIEKRLWSAADDLRVNSKLKSSGYCAGLDCWAMTN